MKTLFILWVIGEIFFLIAQQAKLRNTTTVQIASLIHWFVTISIVVYAGLKIFNVI